MDDGAMLLAAVLAEPDEDIHRLAYADWLDENGRPERAEFVRVQVACSRYTDCPVRLSDLKRGRPVPLRCGACDYCTSRRRSEELSHRFPILPPSIPAYGFCLDPGAVDGNIPHGAGLTVTVRRGFVESVTCSAADFLRHADELVAAHPIERVTITDASGWDARIAQFDNYAPDGTFGCSKWPRIRFKLPSNLSAQAV